MGHLTSCLLVLLVGLSLTGCANFNTAYREFDAAASRDGGIGKSISIDAKQRVILSAPSDRGGAIICAEPSPDALSALSASASGSFSNGADKLVQAALASSESAGSIGLRTQTIQLLRDGMYRICEGYMGGAVTQGEFVSLQRRYQNLMMGLLAIEQLTGAVTPKQVVLSGSSAAGGGNSNTDKEQEALKAAKTEEIDAQANVSNAQKAVETQRSALAKAEEAAKLAIDADKKAPTVDTLQARKTAEAKVVEERALLDEKLIARDKTQALLVLAKESTKFAQQRLALAQGRVSAQASSVGFLEGGTSQLKMAPETAIKVADTVKGIVGDVIQRSFITDACLSAISQGPPSTRPTAGIGVAQSSDSGRAAQISATTSADQAYRVFVDGCQRIFSDALTNATKAQ